MDKKTMLMVAVAAVAVVAVAAAAVYMMGGDDRSGDGDDASDEYYLFLDGMGARDGWYTGTGADAGEGCRSALDGALIPYDITDDGWIKSIDGKAPADPMSEGFALFVYGSSDVSNPYMGYFGTGDVLSKLPGNIIYISLSAYTWDKETGVITYKLNPQTTENPGLKTGGPFADKGYSPLKTSDTYSFFIDNIEGVDAGWCTGEGGNALEAFKNAMDSKKVPYDIDGNFVKSINGKAGEWSKKEGYCFMEYLSSDMSKLNKAFFFTGPTMESILGNVVYISFGTFDESFVCTPNAGSTSADLVAGGPFAA